jgi:hypothetical protein
MSLNCSHQRVYCSSPRWYMSMENRAGMILTGENSWFFHQSAFWHSYQQRHVVANQEELVEGNDEFSLWSICVHTSKWYLHAIKSYNVGLTVLLPFQRKACCRFLKIHCLGWIWTHEPWAQWQPFQLFYVRSQNFVFENLLEIYRHNGTASWTFAHTIYTSTA